MVVVLTRENVEVRVVNPVSQGMVIMETEGTTVVTISGVVGGIGVPLGGTLTVFVCLIVVVAWTIESPGVGNLAGTDGTGEVFVITGTVVTTGTVVV